MHFINNASGKSFVFIQILVSKLLYCISFLLFMQAFFNQRKEIFLISLTLLVVQDPNFYVLTVMLQLVTILFTLSSIWVTILTLSISYLHLRENLKTGIRSKDIFNLPIIYVTNLHKFHIHFLKSEKKY